MGIKYFLMLDLLKLLMMGKKIEYASNHYKVLPPYITTIKLGKNKLSKESGC